MLRANYLVKMILLSVNEKKKKNISKQAEPYVKNLPKNSKIITADNIKVTQDLLNKIIDCVFVLSLL